MAVVSKTDISRKIPKHFKFVKKVDLNVCSIPSAQNVFHDLKGPKVNYYLHYRQVREVAKFTYASKSTNC